MTDSSSPESTRPTDPDSTLTRAAGAMEFLHGATTLPAVDTFPGYEILSEINRGGQGVVYRARQKGTLRDVAIKVPLGNALSSQDGLVRFQREIESVARLRHPNVVSVYHSGTTTDGRPYYVMEYVEGTSLSAHIRAQRLSVEQILELAAEICDGLDAAHRAGVIHRDLKPGNILVDLNGHPRILDFGLARSLDTAPADAISISQNIMGTLAYMAPEQARGDHQHTAERTDIYAMGVILYEALTGRLPHPTDIPNHLVLHSILNDSPPRPSSINRKLRGDLETILLKCLAKEPVRRYGTAAELAEDLRRFLRREAIVAKADSTLYLARKQVERVARRHLITSHITVIAAVVILLHLIVEPLLLRGLGANRWIETWFTTKAVAGMPTADLEHVSIVAFTDDTDIDSLASAAGIEGVSKNIPRSLRRLHGHAMQRLAAMRPLAVVWDIQFLGDSPFDIDLAKGIEALRALNIPVICAVNGWWADGKTPGLGSRFAHLVKWGTIFVGFDSSPPQIQLVMQAGAKDPLPSLALSAVAAARHPDWEPSYSVDDASRSVTILYHQRDPQLSEMKKWHDRPDRIRLGSLHVADDSATKILSTPGVHSMDRIGIHRFQLRSDEVHQRNTVEYSQLFNDNTPAAMNAVAGKIVLLADTRTGADDQQVAPDRVISRCYAHAAAIDELMFELTNQAAVPQSISLFRFLDTLVFALIGLICVLAAPRFGWLLLGGLTVASAVICIKVAASLHMIWNPLLPVLGMFITAGLTVGLSRVTRPTRVGND